METQGDTDTGNKKIRIRQFIFTYWVDLADETQRSQFISWFKNGKKYAVQTEICPETGAKHWQGYVSFTNPRDLEKCRKTYEGLCWMDKCKSTWASEEYCKKLNTRLVGGESWYKGVQLPVRDPMEGIVYKDWQMEIATILTAEPDDRKIFWYYDSVGGSGKSAFTTHLCLSRDDTVMVKGKAGDMKYALRTWMETQGNLRVVIMNLARSQEGKFSYMGLEEIKDGHFFSGKYESGSVIMNRPHIIVFANWPPDEEALSKDRWQIREIGTHE